MHIRWNTSSNKMWVNWPSNKQILTAATETSLRNETTISTGVLTYDSRLQVDKHSSGNVLPGARLAEEGVEGVVSSTDGFVRGHLPVWLYAMLQTVEFPTGIANLHPSLSNVDRDGLTLKKRER